MSSDKLHPASNCLTRLQLECCSTPSPHESMHSLSTLEIDNAVVTGNRCLAGRKKLFYISQRGYYITTKYNEKCDKSPLYCLLSLHRSNIGSRCEHQDSSIIRSFATTRLISLVWFIPHIKTHPRSGV